LEKVAKDGARSQKSASLNQTQCRWHLSSQPWTFRPPSLRYSTQFRPHIPFTMIGRHSARGPPALCPMGLTAGAVSTASITYLKPRTSLPSLRGCRWDSAMSFFQGGCLPLATQTRIISLNPSEGPFLSFVFPFLVPSLFLFTETNHSLPCFLLNT